MERMQDDAATGGYGEVHAHVSTGTSSGAAGSPGSMGGADDAAAKAEGVKDRVQQAAGDAQHKVEDAAAEVKDRAKAAAGEAKQKAHELGDRAGEVVDRAKESLEEAGVMQRIESNPLAALGIAFGLGYLLAGSPEPKGRRSGMAHSAKNQLKGAVMGGLSAAVAQEFRSMIGMGQSGSDKPTRADASSSGYSSQVTQLATGQGGYG